MSDLRDSLLESAKQTVELALELRKQENDVHAQALAAAISRAVSKIDYKLHLQLNSMLQGNMRSAAPIEGGTKFGRETPNQKKKRLAAEQLQEARPIRMVEDQENEGEGFLEGTAANEQGDDPENLQVTDLNEPEARAAEYLHDFGTLTITELLTKYEGSADELMLLFSEAFPTFTKGSSKTAKGKLQRVKSFVENLGE